MCACEADMAVNLVGVDLSSFLIQDEITFWLMQSESSFEPDQDSQARSQKDEVKPELFIEHHFRRWYKLRFRPDFVKKRV